jgi:hypothetical protein
MTKKHFIEIAAILRIHLDIAETAHERAMVANISRNLAHEFAQINRNFSYQTFYTAIGLTPSGYIKEHVA